MRMSYYKIQTVKAFNSGKPFAQTFTQKKGRVLTVMFSDGGSNIHLLDNMQACFDKIVENETKISEG